MGDNTVLTGLGGTMFVVGMVLVAGKHGAVLLFSLPVRWLGLGGGKGGGPEMENVRISD